MKIIGIDLGDESTVTAEWKNGISPNSPGSAAIVVNDFSQHLSESFVAYRKKSINICDHARSAIAINLPNYIWSYKGVIGTNCLVSDINEEKEKEHLKPNLEITKDRAFYKVLFDGQPLEVDAETAISLIIEYQIYLAFKDPTDGYSDVPQVAKRLMETDSKAVITFPLYYTKAHLRGLQMALDMRHIQNVVFVPENVAQFLVYAYYANNAGDFQKGLTAMLVDMGNSATTVSVFRCEENRVTVLAADFSFLGGRDFTFRVKKDLTALFDKERPLERKLDKLSEQLRERTLYNIGEAAKKVKKNLSMPSVEDVDEGIRLLDADEDEDDILLLSYTREMLEKSCNDLFEEFRAFLKGFLESDAMKGVSLDRCEVVGGGTRMPNIQTILSEELKSHGHSISCCGNGGDS